MKPPWPWRWIRSAPSPGPGSHARRRSRAASWWRWAGSSGRLDRCSEMTADVCAHLRSRLDERTCPRGCRRFGNLSVVLVALSSRVRSPLVSEPLLTRAGIQRGDRHAGGAPADAFAVAAVHGARDQRRAGPPADPRRARRGRGRVRGVLRARGRLPERRRRARPTRGGPRRRRPLHGAFVFLLLGVELPGSASRELGWDAMLLPSACCSSTGSRCCRTSHVHSG